MASFQQLFFFNFGHLSQITIIMSQGMPGEGSSPESQIEKKKTFPKDQKTFKNSISSNMTTFQGLFFFILGHFSPITIIMSHGTPGEGKAPLRAKLKKQNLPKRPKNLPK